MDTALKYRFSVKILHTPPSCRDGRVFLFGKPLLSPKFRVSEPVISLFRTQFRLGAEAKNIISAFVVMALRASKYRNATSNVYRPDFQYPNLSLTTASGDGTVVAGNMWWIALAWHSNVGGAVAVLSAEQAGRRDGNPPLIQAHSGQINEMAWNPFHDWILATGGSDGLAKVWKLPQEGLTSDTNEAMVVLNGHGKRVDTLAWNPVASNIIATGGTDNTVKVWDINDASGGAKLTVSHFADNVDSLAWNYNGSLMAAVSREKKLRVFDPRTSTVSAVRKKFSLVKCYFAFYLIQIPPIRSISLLSVLNTSILTF